MSLPDWKDCKMVNVHMPADTVAKLVGKSKDWATRTILHALWNQYGMDVRDLSKVKMTRGEDGSMTIVGPAIR